MKVTYEIENGKKVKVESYDNGSVYKYDENGNEIYHKYSFGDEYWSKYNCYSKNGALGKRIWSRMFLQQSAW